MRNDSMAWWTPADRLAYNRAAIERDMQAAKGYNLQPSPGVLERLERELDRLTGVLRA